jgi:hypothetical protein
LFIGEILLLSFYLTVHRLSTSTKMVSLCCCHYSKILEPCFIEAAMCGEHNIYIRVPRSPFIRDGEIEEGGCVDRLIIVYCIPYIITVLLAFALLIYRSSGILWQIFCQTGIFRGFLKIPLFCRQDQRFSSSGAAKLR